jgi:hypothetical protein
MTPFRWKNCFADVQASKHDITIQSYLHEVILPALDALDRRIDALGRSDEPGNVFAQADMRDVLRETKLAFALAVQSIWERQLRAYLRGCATELRPGEPFATKIERAKWKELRKLFRDLREIELEAFPSFDVLDTLHHIGNACRHGEGESAAELSRRCPDFWRTLPPLPGLLPLQVNPHPVATMDIPVDRLRSFVDAIATLWQDAEYIYNESIGGKDPTLEAWLVRARAERKWVPRPLGGVGTTDD